VLLNLALVCIAVGMLMPPCLPGRQPTHDPARRIRIVTWNVREEFSHVPEIGAALGELKPDIVCLQESRRGNFGEALPGGAMAHTHEVTTITRGRIVAQREIRLGSYPNFRWGIETDIELPQGRLKVLNVHFLASFSASALRASGHDVTGTIGGTELARELERDALLQWWRETTGPRVAAGDYNTPPNAALYRDLAAVATDAFGARGRGWGWTYRRDYPMLRIDYVFCGEEVRPVTAFSRDGGVSDHRMVVVDLVVKEERPASPRDRATQKGSAR